MISNFEHFFSIFSYMVCGGATISFIDVVYSHFKDLIKNKIRGCKKCLNRKNLKYLDLM